MQPSPLPAGALDGVRVLDLTHMLAGPWASMLMADLGADVVKIEPPGTGERTRRLLEDHPDYSLDGMGAYHLTLARNKRSVALDLKSDRGHALFLELARTADVVLTNFAVGVTERLRIDHDTLAALHPRLVTCAISGFGETGPRRHDVAFDMVAQAVGGGMSITGLPGGPPLRAGLPVGDLGAGMMAVIGILSALHARATTGRGQPVDVSMHDTQRSMLTYLATMAFLSGRGPEPMGNAHPVHVPYDTFPASDGWFVVAVIFDPFWANLMAIVDAPELDVPAHRTQPGRLASRGFIMERLTAIFRQAPRDVWLARLREARIPCGPVHSVSEALEDPHTAARGMVVSVPGPAGSVSRQVGNPVKLSGAPPTAFKAAPRLGAHTREVLGALGLSAALDQLQLDGIIGGPGDPTRDPTRDQSSDDTMRST